MSKRSECTIFLITGSEVVRADFAGKNGQHFLGLERSTRDAAFTAADTVQLALSTQSKVGRRCFVFETSVWSQIVSVPKRSIEDIQPAELQNALKFEVETLSGVDADSSALGIAELVDENPAQASFWINVAQSDLFESLSDTLKASGAKWVSLAHPAGFAADSGRKSQSVELWENVAILLEKLVPRNIAGLTSRWPEQLGLGTVSEALENVAVFAQNQSMVGESADLTGVRSLDNEEALNVWLNAAARRGMSESVNYFPLVKSFEQVTQASSVSTTLLRVLAAGLVTLFCFWHWSWLEKSQSKVEQEIVELEQPAIDKRGFDQQLAQVREQRSTLEQDANAAQLKMKKVEYLLQFQKSRLANLLAELKKLRTEDLVISKIELHESGIVVSGLTLNSNSAPELAKQLTTVVTPMGWSVNPAAQEGKNQLTNGGPYEFSILLADVGPGQPLGGKSEKSVRAGGRP
jgi:hypothetical protein